MLDHQNTRNGREPIPEMLGRRDVNVKGEWDIKACAAQRGAPMTVLVRREMHVPVEDDEIARVIRAHEMMHAKVSPIDRKPWTDRGIATDRAYVAAEELRVNYLIERQGFNTKALLDGSEIVSGETLAQRGDWAGAIYTLAATTHTGGLNKFITGVRRHNPAWADTLRELSKELKKMLKYADKGKGKRRRGRGRLTNSRDYNGIGPEGYLVTEEIAEWLDRLANPPKPEDDEQGRNEQAGEQAGESADGQAGQTAPVKREDLKRNKPIERESIDWDNLRIDTLPLTRHAPGGLGVKRLPAQRGRNPRRLQRALLDPHRRVFDQKIRGKGGIVIIDMSGSMRLDMAEVLRIVEAAPGCTVVGYSSPERDGPNMVILADRGKMVAEVPKWRRRTNGVDFPVLQWAVKRRRGNEPIVWVTDGLVHPQRVGYRDAYGIDCIKAVIANKILVVPNPEKAVDALTKLRNGRKTKGYVPGVWQSTWRKKMGQDLRKYMR